MEYIESEGDGDDGQDDCAAAPLTPSRHADSDANSSTVDGADAAPRIGSTGLKQDIMAAIRDDDDPAARETTDEVVIMRKRERPAVSDRASKRLSTLPQGYRLSSAPAFMIPPTPAHGFDPHRPVPPPRPKP